MEQAFFITLFCDVPTPSVRVFPPHFGELSSDAMLGFVCMYEYMCIHTTLYFPHFHPNNENFSWSAKRWSNAAVRTNYVEWVLVAVRNRVVSIPDSF